MTMELSGRRVFITGGAQGIGRGMTTALLVRGARVLFCDINANIGKATEADLQKQYGAHNVSFVQCDVTNADQLKAAFQTAVSKFGAVEICCNNAGIVNEKSWEKTIEVNTIAQIRGSKMAFEHMRRDKGGQGGVIINTVSLSGLIPNHLISVYVASKHAMIGFTTSCARDSDVATKGVRWCCLCPMPVDNGMPMVIHSDDVKDGNHFRKAMEVYGIVEPEEVVQAFLKIVQDTTNNGCIMAVLKGLGPTYCKRMATDEEGESQQLIDTPLTDHPPVPGVRMTHAKPKM